MIRNILNRTKTKKEKNMCFLPSQRNGIAKEWTALQFVIAVFIGCFVSFIVCWDATNCSSRQMEVVNLLFFCPEIVVAGAKEREREMQHIVYGHRISQVSDVEAKPFDVMRCARQFVVIFTPYTH